MSKSTGRSHRKKGSTPPPARTFRHDRGIYIGFVVIGLAVVVAALLLWEGRKEVWGPVALGYVAALAWLTNLYAFRAYRGLPLANWQQALARLPLRAVGFGTRHGKPVEAAHNAPKARTGILIGVVVSLVIIVALSLVLIPGLPS
jgi:hypothetical protein